MVLIFLVLMHSGKDSGLSGAFGVGSGQGPLGGGSLVERNLNRWTIFFAVAVLPERVPAAQAPLGLSVALGISSLVLKRAAVEISSASARRSESIAS